MPRIFGMKKAHDIRDQENAEDEAEEINELSKKLTQNSFRKAVEVCDEAERKRRQKNGLVALSGTVVGIVALLLKDGKKTKVEPVPEVKKGPFGLW